MKLAFVLRWRTHAMPAPAFWYFANAERARVIQREFLRDGRHLVATVTPCEVGDDTPLFDEEIRDAAPVR